MFTLLVKRGIHRIGGRLEEVNGRIVTVEPGKNIARGGTFKSKKDLSLTDPEKYQRVTEDQVNTLDKESTNNEYQKMTVDELRELCEELGIEIPNGLKKAEIIDLINQKVES